MKACVYVRMYVCVCVYSVSPHHTCVAVAFICNYNVVWWCVCVQGWVGLRWCYREAEPETCACILKHFGLSLSLLSKGSS